MSFNSTSKELIEQNINGLLSIHESWLRIPMDSVANITNGFAFKSAEFNNRKDGVPLIRIRDVLKGNTSTYYSGQIPEGYWVYPEDLIVGMDGDFNTTIWRSEPALLNQRVCKIEVQEDKYNKRFFYHALPGYLSAINANTSSVTVKHLSSRTLQDTLLPLPPLAEQKIIAEKLDTLLAQVDSTKARLEQIPQILKRFRQAVLAAAVNGHLNKTAQSNTKKRTLQEVGIIIKTGPFGSALHKSDYISNGIPVINPMHINDGIISPSLSMTISDEKYAELCSWSLQDGDVIVGRRGEMGRAAVVNIGQSKMLCGTGSMILRTKENIEPRYLELILRSPTAISYFNKEAVGSTMVNLNQKVINSLEAYIPNVEEQREIVRRVEQLFAYADTIEKQVNNALARVNNLTQSILAKAFRGELTAQWRAENPDLISGENSAAALLEKIKAERAASGSKKASRKKS
ncbi:restriction endonuclease subunit S [Escherichia coli]|nr:restriction endonuclease subunit S [Escherichia coli]MBA8289185.1 restriction endonuclease subunit S [Escherichia coli]QMA65454.1 restriction endonuclease subunit S [Escherichia coli]QMG08314.1 restriction endonuclease subunit S [Escherichia coli]QMG36592.1 restriction endonuclease subunit S [Escherichia coli]